MVHTPDAIVVGSGPNGLAAAILLAQAGRTVTVFETDAIAGGGMRSAEMTLPGFVHDICSAVHPFAPISPAFRSLPLAQHGLEWIRPPAMCAHPLHDGTAASVVHAVRGTAAGLGGDGKAYAQLIGPTVADWAHLEEAVLGPPRWPRHPFALARFGRHAIRSAHGLASSTFADAPARALFAGLAAHGMLPLEHAITAAFGLVLGATAHLAGWVFPRGGAQRLADALVAHLRSLGGEVITNAPVTSLDDLPPARAILCDLSPGPFLRIAGHRLRPRTAAAWSGTGMAWVSSRWIGHSAGRFRGRPRRARARQRCTSAARSRRLPRPSARHGRGGTRSVPSCSWRSTRRSIPHARRPGSTPPGGTVTCRTGPTVDMLPRIEAQIERFAPGFRDRILARHVMPPAALERHNPNYVGGDIAAGVPDAWQLVARPTLSHYSTPVRGPVSLLRIDAAWRGGAWDVRLSRGPSRAPRGAARL